MAQSSSPQAPKFTNRLARETSPYLLQHAHNPVDWYPWGREALEAARAQNKPIFLSVGYSTCYWCHVMERQCFENEQIAAEMNRLFINIKVDREERPDVDQLYMTAVQVLTRHGGWPMSVFLTPDGRPFYAGTYFPPVDTHGRPGFLTLMRALSSAYAERPQEVEQTASQMVEILGQLSEPQAPESPATISRELVDELVDRSTADYDSQHGGFGPAPKFPRQTLLEMLLVYLRHMPGDIDPHSDVGRRKGRLLDMLTHTLDAMAEGGMRDHLGGGFHRYATDQYWLVPHFEIMLYDNAMLAWCYLEAYRQTEAPRHAKVARGILDFVLREMTSPDGGFYSAFDAEVDAREGASYLWTAQQVSDALREAGFADEDAALFARVYGLDQGPNFSDPHHGDGHPDQNVLFLPEALENTARQEGLEVDELDDRLEPMRQALYKVRRGRKQPMLDTKIITSWAAMMVRALAYGGRVLSDERYMAAAARGADFLLKQHASSDGGVWRTSRDGQRKYPGFLDDYAFLVHALLDLEDAGGDESRRDQAKSLAGRMMDRFYDEDRGGFYFTPDGEEELIVRQKLGTDSPLPSGNAIAARAMQRLRNPDVTRDTLACFARQLEASAEAMSSMLETAIHYLRDRDPIAVGPGPWRGGDRAAQPEQVAADAVRLVPTWHGERELHLSLHIRKPLHLNAHDAQADLVGTHVTVLGEAGAEVESIDYPPGEEQKVLFADQTLRIYSGDVTIRIRFSGPQRRDEPIRLSLVYQACDEKACLPPITRTVELATP